MAIQQSDLTTFYTAASTTTGTAATATLTFAGQPSHAQTLTLNGSQYVFNAGSPATGTITLSGLPLANDTFVIGTQTFTFKASRAGTGDVAIGADAPTTAANILTAISADIPSVVTVTVASNVVTVVSVVRGTAGNSIVLTKNATNVTVSGSGTLSGGAVATSSGNNIAIKTTLALTLTETATVLTASADSQVSLCSYSATSTTLVITYKTVGTAGNGFTVVTNVTGATPASTVLAGGSAGDNPFDPNEGEIPSNLLSSNFEKNVVSLIAAGEFIITAMTDPSSDYLTSRQQRKCLKRLLNKLGMLIPTTANPSVDDRATIGAAVRTVAIDDYNTWIRNTSL